MKWRFLLLVIFAVCAFSGRLSLAGEEIEVPDAPRSITLTFDDGPRPKFEPQLLDFLKEEHLHATFFVQGWQAEANPDLIRRLADEGHELGNHTYGHGRLDVYLKKKGKRWVLNDITRASDVTERLVGYRPLFFRPPHWVIGEKYRTAWTEDFGTRAGFCGGGFPENKLFKEELLCKGYLVQVLDDPTLPANFRVIRDVNTTDYEFHERYKKNPKEATAALTRTVRALIGKREKEGVRTHVLVFHELPVSLAVLRVLVPEWREKGYEFKTLREVYGL